MPTPDIPADENHVNLGRAVRVQPEGPARLTHYRVEWVQPEKSAPLIRGRVEWVQPD
jgi:hypothetical protein